MFRPIVHLALHLIIPGIAARWLFKERWKTAWLMMMLTLVIDLDHLLSEPIFDPNRCGISFHPLHSYPAIALYIVFAIMPRTRVIGFGLMIHILLDGLDCFWME